MKLKTRKKLASIIYHILVVIGGFIMIYPVLWMITGSLKNNTELLNGSLSLIPPNWRWENFARGWKGFGGVTFVTFFKNSFIITSISTFATVISSACIAYSFARLKYPGRKLMFTLMIMTMLLPGQILLIPMYIIYNNLGQIGRAHV